MTIDLDDERIKKFLSEVIGEKAFEVAKACEGGEIDENIAEEVDEEVSEIRSLLNQLHYKGVVDYTKEQSEKTNWCTYTWFLNEEQLKELIKENWEEKVEELEKKLEEEKNYVFFKCKNGCERLPFELAVEYDFRCPKCGSELNKSESDEKIDEIQEKIDDIEEIVSEME